MSNIKVGDIVEYVGNEEGKIQNEDYKYSIGYVVDLHPPWAMLVWWFVPEISTRVFPGGERHRHYPHNLRVIGHLSEEESSETAC